MQTKNKQILFFLLKTVHLIVSIAIFYVFWLLAKYNKIMLPLPKDARYNYYAAGYAIVLYLFSRTYNAYLLGYTRIRGLAFAQFISQFFAIGITYVTSVVAWSDLWSPVWLFPMLGVQALWDCVWSFFTSNLYFKTIPPKRALLIYRNETDKKRFGSVAGKPVGRIYQVVDELKYDGYRFKEIKDKLEGYEAIFVAGINSRCRNGISKYCVEKNIPGYFLPHVGDILMRGAAHIQTFTSPVLFFSKKYPTIEYLFCKRAFDIIMSLLGIIVFRSCIV